MRSPAHILEVVANPDYVPGTGREGLTIELAESIEPGDLGAWDFTPDGLADVFAAIIITIMERGWSMMDVAQAMSFAGQRAMQTPPPPTDNGGE